MRPLSILRTFALPLVLVLAIVPAVSAQDQELPLGSPLPTASLQLTTPGGEAVTLANAVGGSGTAIVFWSNACPWVDKYEDRLVELAGSFANRGITFLAVNANDPTAFPDESGEASRQRASALGNQVTFVMDRGSLLAKALGASRTPHVFVFDADQTLVYTGTLDDSPGDPGNVSKTYLSDALDAVVAGTAVSVPKTKAFGCTLKPQS